MDKDMMHLAKITLANLKAGSINPSDADIIAAMNKAVAKEDDMHLQLLASPNKLDAFSGQISNMIYDRLRAM